MSSNVALILSQARIKADNCAWSDFKKSMQELQKNILFFEVANIFMTSLWFDYALQKKEQHFHEYSEWLIEMQTTGEILVPKIGALIEQIAELPELDSVIKDPKFKLLWLQSTVVPVPNKEWRQKFNVTTHIYEKYREWMLNQPLDVQSRQREYLQLFGSDAILKKPFLYFAITTYGEPTKEQVTSAATVNNPVYDMERLEKYYPGISGMRAVLEGLGLTPRDVGKKLNQFISNAIEPKLIELNSFEFMHENSNF